MQSNWFTISVPNPNAKLRVICFPYAGGNAIAFNRWPAMLNSHIELIAIQPPGRSNRVQEAPFNKMDDLIDNLMQVFPSILDKPYAIFGHSLGSRIGFELLDRLQHQGLRLPEHFIASGSRGPHVPCLDSISYDLPDDKFILKLKTMGGTPEELLNSKELMELLLPMIKADFQIAETHCFTGNTTFDIPLTVLGGKQDQHASILDLKTWQPHFSQPANYILFNGGHFFIDSHQKEVLARLNQIFERIICQQGFYQAQTI